MRQQGGRSPAGAVLLGGLATVAGVLPVFLTGALAVPLMDDLAFTATALGIAIAVFRLSSSASSRLLGQLADRIGATWSIRLAMVISAVACLGLSATATSWVSLTLWLAIGGLGAALSQPAANRMLANVMQPHQLGRALGIKQSAAPTATMLAGLSVPAIAFTIGWRWAFVLTSALAIVVIIAAGWRPSAPNRALHRRAATALENKSAILLLATAFGLGTAASTSATAFYVDSAVRLGESEAFAGAMLAVGSIAAIVVRLVAGFASDRMSSGHLKICTGLLAAGSVGFGLLALENAALVEVGICVALAGTWGFNGVLWFALIRAYATRPGAITGAVAPGGLLGGAIGPVVFGLLIDRVSYGAAWWFGALSSVLAAGTMIIGAQRLGPYRS